MQLTGGLPQRFADQMGALLGPDFPTEIGLAVSGGGDSMAMLHLAAVWAREFGVSLRVVTIDHGLRGESAAEAQLVADEVRGLGLTHDTLQWRRDGGGNLQDAARQARLDLIGQWRGNCDTVLFAHTQDDQAETLLMRLARGSGVDGLSGMSAKRDVGGWALVRPLLTFGRKELRHFADTLKIPYVNDPTNEDDAYARVRMRKLIGKEGLDVQTLSETAERLQNARFALEMRAFETAKSIQVHDETSVGSVIFDRDGFADVDKETQLRLLAGALQHVSQSDYRPRYAPLKDLCDRVLAGGTGTLSGCQVSAKGEHLYVFRELKAVSDLAIDLNEQIEWDRRFLIFPIDIKGLQVRPLGEGGYRAVTPKPKTGRPMGMSLSYPSLWRKEELVACAPLDFGPKYVVQLTTNARKFPELLLTH